MKPRPCPKCGGTDIRASKRSHTTLPVTPLRSATLKYHVCVACGHVETYIEKAEQLKRIAENWKPRDS